MPMASVWKQRLPSVLGPGHSFRLGEHEGSTVGRQQGQGGQWGQSVGGWIMGTMVSLKHFFLSGHSSHFLVSCLHSLP